jgi:hypothetical protein
MALVIFVVAPLYAQITWTEHNIDPYFNGAWGIDVADMDDDGDLDVVGTAKDGDDVAWYANDGSQNFSKFVIDAAFDGAWCVKAVDVDGDLDMDVVAAAQGPSYAGYISWWENDGSMNFTHHSVTTNYPYCAWVDAADLDGDGDIDFLATATWDDRIGWWENDGSENFTYENLVPYLRFPYFVRAVDLDQDDDMDFIAGAAYEEITYWENDGNLTFTRHDLTSLDSCFSTYLAVADMNGDGALDILAPELWFDNVYYLENSNDGNMIFTTYFMDNSFDGAYYVEAADIDNDGDMDAVGAAWADDAIRWWENEGGYMFTGHNISLVFDKARQSIPVDLNCDGAIDVVGSAQTSDVINWWESDLDVPIGTVEGLVTDASSSMPIENVKVAVAGTIYETLTDASGYYSFPCLVADTFDVSFSHADYIDTTAAGVIVSANDTTTLDVAMNPPGPLMGSIGGTVTDASTTDPIENVHVTAEGTTVEAYTDINGDYLMSDLEEGDYDITFSHADYNDTTVSTVTVTGNQTTTLDVAMSAPEGYQYVAGDANMYVGQWPPQVIGGDVTFLVNYFRGVVQPCLLGGFYCSGDANGDCQVIGSDVTRMVNYFRGIIGILPCPDYESAWPTPEDIPETAPDGWPNCEPPPLTGGQKIPVSPR